MTCMRKGLKVQVSPVNLNRNLSLKRTNKTQSVVVSQPVSFKSCDKNLNQILSIAPEHKGLGLKSYSEGGLAVVAQEAPASWVQEGYDVRSIVPYHFNTPSRRGKMAIIRFPNEEAAKIKRTAAGVNYDDCPVYAKPEWIHEVSSDYTPSKNEIFAVIDKEVDIKTEIKKIDGKETVKKTPLGYKYLILEPTDIKGEVKSLKEGFLEEEKVPYKLFKLVGKNGTKGEKKYFMYTPQVSAMGKCYGFDNPTYSPGQIIGGTWGDFYYSNFNRAVADALPQLSAKEGFKPASVWMHDRPMFSFQFELLNRILRGEEFYSGYRVHSTLHNPGIDYQGWFDDLTGYMKIAFNSDDFEKLRNHPEFSIIKDIVSKTGKPTKEDKARISAILGKYFENLFDEFNRPNITMIPILNSELNDSISTVGTVSKHYGKEMKIYEGIARGLTSKLAKIKTHDVTNGSAPASLGIEKRGNFGQGNNGLTANNLGYTPYKPIIDKDKKVVNYDKSLKELDNDIYREHLANYQKLEAEIFEDEKTLASMTDTKQKALFEAKIAAKKDTLACQKSVMETSVKDAKFANKKWILDMISQCNDKDGKPIQDKLNSLFLNINQINGKQKVHGTLTAYQPGDILYTNWGRPDPQKGFSTYLQGYIKFLKDKSVPDDTKKHVKLLFGSGGIWKEGNPEGQLIYGFLDEIKKLGYESNCCYVEGFFPNKLVACNDFGSFTSRFEPCGITPFECYSAGVPVASINTGGAGNFVFDLDAKGVTKPTGFLTDDPFMVSEETLKEKGLFDKEIVKKEILATDEEWTDAMQKVYDKKLDAARREYSSDQVSNFFKRTMSIDSKTYDMLAKNACEQEIEWHNNRLYNEGKSANEIYMKEIFQTDTQRKPCKVKKLTGDFGDGKGLSFSRFDDEVQKQISIRKGLMSENVEKGGHFLSKLIRDRRAKFVVASIAIVAGIAGFAIKRNSSGNCNVKASVIGNSKVYF